MEKQTCSKLGKEYLKAAYFHCAYLTYMQCTSCKMPGWMNHKMESIAGRNISNLRYADDTNLTAESEEQLKSLLMRVKEESERAGLKLNIKKTKIVASNPITSWKIEGGKVEAMKQFTFGGSEITAGSDCSHEIKTLAPWRKSRDITLPTNVHIVKAETLLC